MNNAYLVRIYGDVEPKVVHGPFDKYNISAALIEYLKKEPYDEEDGLYLLTFDNNRPVMDSFGDGFMWQCRHYAEGTFDE